MGIKEMFSRKETEPRGDEPTQKRNDAKASAQQIVQELIALEKSGNLERTPEEYVREQGFLKLLSEFTTYAAVRIFDAESKLESAREEGRQGAITDIRRRHEMPRSMRASSPATAETDYSKMSSEAFSRLKKSLQSK